MLQSSRAHVARLGLCLTLLPGSLAAQASGQGEAPKQFNLDNLRTPASPAFTLLGISPTAIARPSTPRALAVELLSKAEKGPVIPNSYALEVAPYWLRPRPTLSFETYTRPSAGQSIRQSFSLSLGIDRADTTSDTSATRIALGARVAPNGGRPSARFRALTDSLDSLQRRRIPVIRKHADALDSLDEAQADLREAELRLAATDTTADATATRVLHERIKTLRARGDASRARAEEIEAGLRIQADSMRTLATMMGTEEGERVGFFTELATAVATSYAGNQFQRGRLSRVGVWGSASYRIEAPRLDVIGLVRVQRDVLDADQSSLDIGGRLFWLYHRLGVSGEIVNRTAFDADAAVPSGGATPLATFESSTRAVGIVDFRATDALYVTLSLGQDHRTPGAARRPLVAAFGLNFQWGDKPVVTLPKGR